jgi:hypothetical protein
MEKRGSSAPRPGGLQSQTWSVATSLIRSQGSECDEDIDTFANLATSVFGIETVSSRASPADGGWHLRWPLCCHLRPSKPGLEKRLTLRCRIHRPALSISIMCGPCLPKPWRHQPKMRPLPESRWCLVPTHAHPATCINGSFKVHLSSGRNG